MKAIILAGGEGNRLRPLTCDIPKPMVPIMNVPIMEHIINLLKRQGIFEIGVTLMYLSQKIVDYFGDGSSLGVKLHYFTEDIPLGTAGSVKNAENFFDDTFFVISGDSLFDTNISDVLNFHKTKKSIATIVLKKVKVPLQYGVVVTNQEGEIINFLEKPTWGEVISDTVNTGAYIFEPEIFKYIQKGKPVDFSRDLFPTLLNEGIPTYGYVMEGYWRDIGDINSYFKAHIDFLEKKINLKTNLKEVEDTLWIGNGVKISEGVKISAPCFIGDNCTFGKGTQISSMTIIGDGNIFEENVSIKRSLIWNNNYFESFSQVQGAILCNKVNVRSYVTIYEDSVIGDNCIIGERAIIRPEVRIWPHKNIEHVAVVDRSVIWNKKNLKTIFNDNEVSGIINVDINPEFSTRLGAAYGSVLKKGAKVIVSSTTSNSTRMFKHAFISGLLSVGVEVYNLSSLLTPIARHAINFISVDGGIHIKLCNNNPNKIKVDFMDSKGACISRILEKKIESNFFKEDYSRCSGEEISRLNNITDFRSYYVRAILSKVDDKIIKSKKINIFVMSQSDFVLSIIIPILTDIGCKVSSFLCEDKRSRNKIKEKFKESEADFGAFIDSNGEVLKLITKEGKIIKDEMFTILTSLIVFKSFKNPKVIVSVTAPSVIEQLAEKYGGKVIKTKSSPKAVMERMLSFNLMKDDEGMMLFLLNFDAIASLIKIIEFVVLEGTSLTKIFNSLPAYYVSKKKIFCPWELKGKVMRKLIMSQKNDNLELMDGVKFKFNNGWVLVSADSNLPLCRVYSEGIDMKSAEENSGIYLEKIKKIINT